LHSPEYRFGEQIHCRQTTCRRRGLRIYLDSSPRFRTDRRHREKEGRSICDGERDDILKMNGFETVDQVVFAQAGDLKLLGSRTLEGFGATVDARKKRLVAAGPQLAA